MTREWFTENCKKNKRVCFPWDNCTALCIRASREGYPRNCRKTIPGGIAFAVRETDAGRERHRRRFGFYYAASM